MVASLGKGIGKEHSKIGFVWFFVGTKANVLVDTEESFFGIGNIGQAGGRELSTHIIDQGFELGLDKIIIEMAIVIEPGFVVVLAKVDKEIIDFGL
jgi:hypothetical protein